VPPVGGPARPAPSPEDKAAAEAARTAEATATREASDAKAKAKSDILAKLKKDNAKVGIPAVAEAPRPAAPAAAKPAADPKSELESLAASNAEVRRLKAELAKFADKKPGESKADLLKQIQEDPTVLFKEIDDPELLVKIAEARQKHLADQDPASKALAEVKAKQAELDKRLADADAEKLTAQQTEQRKAMYAATASLMKDGVKAADGAVEFDHSPYKLCRLFTAEGELDVPARAMEDGAKLIRDLGRKPSDKEVATIYAIVFDKIEAKLRKTVEVSRKAEAEKPKAKIEAEAGPKDRRPQTLTPGIGRGGTVPAIPAPKSKTERKAQVFEKLRAAKAAERARA
jgi:hypothetical protein